MNAGNAYTLYDGETGEPIMLLTCAPEQLAGNLEKNAQLRQRKIVAFDGTLDLISQRIDIESGQPVDVRPSAQQLAVAARELTIRQIEALEAEQDSRFMREVALGNPIAVTRLKAIDQEIVSLRGALK
jgi:hypothetical protein